MRLFFGLCILFSSLLYSQAEEDSLRLRLIKDGKKAYFEKDTTLLRKITSDFLKEYDKNKNILYLEKFHHYNALNYKRLFKNDSAYFHYHESKKF